MNTAPGPGLSPLPQPDSHFCPVTLHWLKGPQGVRVLDLNEVLVVGWVLPQESLQTTGQSVKEKGVGRANPRAGSKAA